MPARDVPLGEGAEFDLVRRILDRARQGDATPSDAVVVGAGDDCAVVRGDGICVSVDMSVENIHFRRDWLEPEEIGGRAAAAALSDLAAVAAAPIGMLVAVAAAASDAALIPRIMAGAAAAGNAVGAVLLGGDLTRTTGPLSIDVVVLGNSAHPVLRRGARPGDTIWVTGLLGGAAAAVRAWTAGQLPDAAARRAFALPTPRTAEAAWLARKDVLHALIDLSDGLAGDASHLAAASGVQILIDAGALPVHPAARSRDGAPDLTLALGGGEDYELCFAARPGAVEALAGEFEAQFDVRLTAVGSVREGRGVLLRTADGEIAPARVHGHDHFARGDTA